MRKQRTENDGPNKGYGAQSNYTNQRAFDWFHSFILTRLWYGVEAWGVC